MAKRKDRTVVDAVTQTVRCEECGEEIPIPLGVIDWVTGVLAAFGKAHRECRKGDKGRTCFSKPKSQGEADVR